MVAERVGQDEWLTIAEVREQFDELIARVEDGESVVIMRDGRVVARLTPCSEPRLDPEVAETGFERFLEERARLGPINATLEEMMAWRHEGHKR